MIIGGVDLDALDRIISEIEEELCWTVNYTLFNIEGWL